MDQIISFLTSSCRLPCHSHPHAAGTWPETSPSVCWCLGTHGCHSRTLTGAYLVLSTIPAQVICSGVLTVSASEHKYLLILTKSSVTHHTAFQKAPSKGLPSEPSFPLAAHTDRACQLFQRWLWFLATSTPRSIQQSPQRGRMLCILQVAACSIFNTSKHVEQLLS